MNAAAQTRFSFNVDDAGLAHADAGGYPCRPAEGVTTDIHHRQAVDLPHLLAGDVDQDSSVGDQLANVLFDPVGAEDPAFERLFDMARRHQLAVFFACPERRFAHQIGNRRIGGEHFFAIAGLTRAELDQSFNAAWVEVRQAFLVAKIADPLAIGELVLLIAAHYWIEVRANLEHLMKVVIPSIE